MPNRLANALRYCERYYMSIVSGFSVKPGTELEAMISELRDLEAVSAPLRRLLI